jgi:hypothetical protein
MAKNSKQLADFFHDILKDIYFAEKKVLAALPKMAKAADHGPNSAWKRPVSPAIFRAWTETPAP